MQLRMIATGGSQQVQAEQVSGQALLPSGIKSRSKSRGSECQVASVPPGHLAM